MAWPVGYSTSMKVGCRGMGRMGSLMPANWPEVAVAGPPIPRRGFSLIELLMVVAILVVLTTLYWGSAFGKRQRQWKLECQKNLEKLYISMEIYGNEHEGRFPLVPAATNSARALAQLVPKYASDTSLFICPSQKGASPPATESFFNAKISYAYYMGRALGNSQQPLVTDAQVDTLSKTAGQVVFSSSGKPPGNNHDDRGGNILYCDGHVVRSPPSLAFPLETGPGVILLNP